MSLFRDIKEIAKKGEEFMQSVKEVQSLKQDIAHIRDWKIAIERLFSFKDGGQLSEKLQDAFKMWLDFQDLRPKYERAETVLSDFLKKDKVLDSLEKSILFAEEIESDDNLKNTTKYFMNQCIYFLHKNVSSMKEKYSNWKEPEKLQPVPKNVQRFIREECVNIPTLKDIPAAYELILRLEITLKELKRTPQQEKDIRTISTCMDLFSQAHKDINGIAVIRDRLSQKIEAMNKTIHDGEELYQIISESMTEEWFDSFSPDIVGSMVSKISSLEELKAFYLERLHSVLEKVKFFVE